MPAFEAALLPDADKERLCRSLLAEFGVTRIRVGGDGEELIHGCVLPFGKHQHQDAEPTASLNWKKLVYKCLGSCDAGGGLLWFIGLCRGTSGNEARKWLDSETGMGADGMSLSALLSYFDAIYSPKLCTAPPMPKMSVAVLDRWAYIHPYLTEIRGIPEANVVRYRVGWDPDANRIVIPHFWKGSLVGWQTRRLLKDGSPKYKASPDLPRESTIFDYDPARDHAVIVESPMSVVAKSHVLPLEATFGNAVTPKQIRYLSHHPRVTLFFDNDEAGWTATEKVGEALQAYCDVRVADNPWNEDVAGLPDEVVAELVRTAIPWSLWSRPKQVKIWRAA
jgi:DNA primase